MTSHEDESDRDITAIARRIKAQQEAREKENVHNLPARTKTEEGFTNQTLTPVQRGLVVAHYIRTLPDSAGKPIFREGELPDKAMRRLANPVTINRLRQGMAVKLTSNLTIQITHGQLQVHRTVHRGPRGPSEIEEPLTPERITERRVRDLQRKGATEQQIIDAVGRKEFKSAVAEMDRRKTEITRRNRRLIRGWRG